MGGEAVRIERKELPVQFVGWLLPLNYSVDMTRQPWRELTINDKQISFNTLGFRVIIWLVKQSSKIK